MGPWETVLAAAGGLLLGLGLGLVLARAADRGLRRRLHEVRARSHTHLVPVLERRAEALGLPATERPASHDNPFEHASALAQAIRGFEDRRELPFSDTVDLGPGEPAPGNLAHGAPGADGGGR